MRLSRACTCKSQEAPWRPKLACVNDLSRDESLHSGTYIDVQSWSFEFQHMHTHMCKNACNHPVPAQVQPQSQASTSTGPESHSFIPQLMARCLSVCVRTMQQDIVQDGGYHPSINTTMYERTSVEYTPLDYPPPYLQALGYLCGCGQFYNNTCRAEFRQVSPHWSGVCGSEAFGKLHRAMLRLRSPDKSRLAADISSRCVGACRLC